MNSGMYILFNDGNLTNLKPNISEAFAGGSKNLFRVYLKFS